MAVPLLDLYKQHAPLMEELRAAFDAAVTGNAFVLGPTVSGFEDELAAVCQVPHAIGVSSGTDALVAALMALEIGPGDEVITTPFTFFATAGSIVRVGARPVFVDIDEASFNIDPQAIDAAVTSRTRAIIPVHLYGLMADMPAIMDIARQRGVRVIEDAAQAIGAKLGDRVVGQFGDITCLSFYPTKNLSAMGDAGACLTADEALATRLKQVRQHGETERYLHQFIGGNFRLDALQAAMLKIKLPHLPAWNEQRRELACRYHRLLESTPLILPPDTPGAHHVYHQYTCRVPDGRRDAFSTFLHSMQVGHGVYYRLPLHLQPCFEALGYKAGDLPRAEAAAGQVISLPIYPGLTEAQQDEVAAAIREFFD